MLVGLHHIVLFCADTAASKAWYDAVGFQYLRGYEGMHWYGVGGAEVMLHPGRGPSGDVPELYVSTGDIEALFAAVRAKGLKPTHHQVSDPMEGPHTTPWGSREFELYDPDGHRWGFVQG